MKKLIWILCLGLWISDTAEAATYFVDPAVTNGDSQYDGTSQTPQGSSIGPWQHLPGTVGPTGSKWKILQDGDVVFVKGGTTNYVQVQIGHQWYNGASNKYDSIRIIGGQYATPAWGTTRPVFHEENLRTYGMRIGDDNSNVYGITLDGFEIKNIKSGGPGGVFGDTTGSATINVGGNDSAHYIKIRNSYLHDSYRMPDPSQPVCLDGNGCPGVNDTGHGIETGGGDHLIIENNLIGPRIGTKGMELYHTHYGIIRNNYVNNTADHGIVISGDHWDVYNNLVDMVPPFAHGLVYAMKIDEGQNNDVWNNVFFHTPNSGSGGEHEAGFGIFDLPNNRFFHNTVYGLHAPGNEGCDTSCIDIGHGGGQTPRLYSNNDNLQNNIANDCRGGAGQNHQLWLNVNTTGHTFKYNSFYYQSPTDAVVLLGIQSGNSIVSFNTVAQFESAAPALGNIATNNVQLSSNFSGGFPTGLDASGHPDTLYFSLVPNTPAAIQHTGNDVSKLPGNGYDPNAGSSKFAFDILGNDRRITKNWSMGAYEYVGGPPIVDNSSPTAPSGLTATAISYSQVNLSWTGSTDAGGSGLAGYNIFRNGSNVGSSGSNLFSDTGLAPLTFYSYTVRAFDGNGNTSLPSNTATATTPAFSNKFNINDRVHPTIDGLNVRSSPTLVDDTNIVGTRIITNQGTVIGGPVSADGNIWWQINYDPQNDTVNDGWCVENYLIKVISSNSFHPADTNTDSYLTLNEATAYGACWRSAPAIPAGCPTPAATLDNSVRAGTLWNSTSNGSYHYDSTKQCPLCWVAP